jgi:hypothetical protein
MLTLHLNNPALGDLTANSFPFGGFVLKGGSLLREQELIAQYIEPYWVSGGCPYRSIFVEPEVTVRFTNGNETYDVSGLTSLQSAMGMLWADRHEPFAKLSEEGNTWHLLKDGSNWPEAHIFGLHV